MISKGLLGQNNNSLSPTSSPLTQLREICDAVNFLKNLNQ